MSDWNTQIITEFRANGGKVAQFGDAPLVILHTIGAKSGELREIPLRRAGRGRRADRVRVRRPARTDNPDWVYNLRANPSITVEYGTETFTADVTELSEADSQAKIQEQAALMPQFGEYVKTAAPRIIPAFSHHPRLTRPAGARRAAVERGRTVDHDGPSTACCAGSRRRRRRRLDRPDRRRTARGDR